MTLIVDETALIDLREPAPPVEPDDQVPFDMADEGSAGLLIAGLASVAVWLVVAVTIRRRLARRRSVS